MGFREIMTALSLIQLINELKDGDWQVFYQKGSGDFAEATAQDLGKGDLMFAPGNFSYIVKAVFTRDGEIHRLRGEGGIRRFSYREEVELDGKKVDNDDIYLSSHLEDDNKRIIVEFRYKHEGARHVYRFKRELNTEDMSQPGPPDPQ